MRRAEDDVLAVGREVRAGAAALAGADHPRRSVGLEVADEDLVGILVRLGGVENRRRHVGGRLEDDLLAVGAKIALPCPGETVGDLLDVLEVARFAGGVLGALGRLARTRGLAQEQNEQDRGHQFAARPWSCVDLPYTSLNLGLV